MINLSTQLGHCGIKKLIYGHLKSVSRKHLVISFCLPKYCTFKNGPSMSYENTAYQSSLTLWLLKYIILLVHSEKPSCVFQQVVSSLTYTHTHMLCCGRKARRKPIPLSNSRAICSTFLHGSQPVTTQIVTCGVKSSKAHFLPVRMKQRLNRALFELGFPRFISSFSPFPF